MWTNCLIPECTTLIDIRGYCKAHYGELERKVEDGKTTWEECAKTDCLRISEKEKKTGKLDYCLTPNCKRLGVTRGLCTKCYQNALRYVNTKQTTWKELIDAGFALKTKRRGRVMSTFSKNLMELQQQQLNPQLNKETNTPVPDFPPHVKPVKPDSTTPGGSWIAVEEPYPPYPEPVDSDALPSEGYGPPKEGKQQKQKESFPFAPHPLEIFLDPLNNGRFPQAKGHITESTSTPQETKISEEEPQELQEPPTTGQQTEPLECSPWLKR